jgi:hypothetical protein
VFFRLLKKNNRKEIDKKARKHRAFFVTRLFYPAILKRKKPAIGWFNYFCTKEKS